MSERFGIPDHSPQHAPDHSLQNPTPQGSWGQDTGGSDWPSSAAPSPSYAAPSHGGGGSYSPGVSVVDPRKSIKAAIVLAMVFGPLGLFYVSFLNGVAATMIVVPIAREVALAVTPRLGRGVDPLVVAIAMMWSLTVPWAIIGATWRNRKLDRRTSS